MTLISVNDLLTAARAADVKPRQAREILAQISESLDQWTTFANQARVPSRIAEDLARAFRQLPPVMRPDHSNVQLPLFPPIVLP